MCFIFESRIIMKSVSYLKQESKQSIKKQVKLTLSFPIVISGVALMFLNMVRYGVLTWIPTYFFLTGNFEIADMGAIGLKVFLIPLAGVIGTLIYNKIKCIESLNHELMVAIYSSKITNFPYCQDCMIKNLCTGGCLGSQYESTGDLFTPIPSVCLLEHGKVQSFIEVLEELNLLTTIIQICSHEKRTAILTFIKKFM